jgi:L-Ala-D/L-Glu epimerase
VHVVQLDASIVRIPLRRAVKHASYTRFETHNLVVRCQLSNGSVGWGEGVPRDYVTGETAESSLKILQETEWKQHLEACLDFAAAVELAERIQLNPQSGDARGCIGNAARCAVELAILDAYGHVYGEPLMNVTHLLAPELYEPQESVRYSGIILSSTGWKARIKALAQRLYGLQQLKIKVGVAGQNDPERLALIRRWSGKKMNLRVDANESWKASESVAKILELEPYQITCVEQPVAHEEVELLADTRKQIQTPIMLDESLCSRNDAERAVRGGYCDAFNLRLSKCGGFIPTLRLAQFAQKNGLFCQLGCQVGESGILSAAGRHFATSVKELRYLEGSYDRRLVREAFTVEDLTFGRGGRAPMLVGSGLGVEVCPERVDACTVQREVLFRAS